MDLTMLYGGKYSQATYGLGLKEAFDRITSLPVERSDNLQRRNRILGFMSSRIKGGEQPTLLDVGSGLGVFPYAMKQAGWLCTALDPDPRVCSELERNAEVRTIVGTLESADPEAIGVFDLVTLNKVLEHIEQPCEFLRLTRPFIGPGGVVYVEVPDGESAALEEPLREEFFIEHHHVFSPASLCAVVNRSGFKLLELQRLQEPSGKLSLACFVVPEVLT